MAKCIEGVLDTGFTVVHASEHGDGTAVVDIVIIHGLQGHPFSTWASPKPKPKTKERNRKSIRARVLGRIRADPGEASNQSLIFWPRDMLPSSCPRSRILVYGYDSNVTRYMRAATNKNSIFAHAKDLLFALSRERELDRPLLLIAHSLGGIVVKEMLAQSSLATDNTLKNIVDSTSSVIFLGTPHRGSPGLAAVGEWARSLVGSALRMETNDAILNALNLKTTDLERAQESFSRIWLKQDFRVKTFQEGLGLTGVHLSVFGNKVVPDHSSLIGDIRERAETIQANHMEMCRFTGPEDPNYAKLLGEILAVYKGLIKLTELNVHCRGHIQRAEQEVFSGSIPPRHETGELKTPPLRAEETSALKSLWYPSMNNRQHSLGLEKPAPKTCGWLFGQQEYQEWLLDRGQEKYCGLIWLKGKPGAGKSTLVNEAFRHAERDLRVENRIAAFFFNAKGSKLEHSAQGLYRSLLYQLLPHHPSHLGRLVDLLSAKEENPQAAEERPTLTEPELKELLSSLLHEVTGGRTFIFIDALDECDVDSVRPLAYFWRDITKHIPNLSVCITSRHYPSVTVANCPDIMVDKHNNSDIAKYVDQRLGLSIDDNEPEKEIIKSKILEKAEGVFLWVTLVVDDILRKRDEGKALNVILNELDEVPTELEALFSNILETVEPGRYKETLRLFQWAILATKPLRLYEWEHILGFMVQPPLSLWDWRAREGQTGSRRVDSEKVEKQIRTLSKGLLEVRLSGTEDIDTERGSSIDAGAGSLESGDGVNGVIQVIHESVREFFLKKRGFGVLGGEGSVQGFIADGHLAIMETCLDYINVAELDALVKARSDPRVLQPQRTGREWSPPLSEIEVEDHRASRSVRSFGSAYSHVNSHTNSRRAVSPGRNPHAGTTNTATRNGIDPEGEPSVFEMLKKSADEAWSRDYGAQRMALYNIAADEISINPSVVPRSAAGETRILEDYPALLSYAVFEIFAHARLAQVSRADPTAIVNRFREMGDRLWIRWLALAEDLPLGTSLFFYAAENGLLSWMAVMDRCPNSNHRTVGAEEALSSGLVASSQHPNSQDGNPAPRSTLLERMFTTVVGLYTKLACECRSCYTVFDAMEEAAKSRNVATLKLLSQYSQVGIFCQDSNHNTILHVLARIDDVSFLRAYIHNTGVGGDQEDTITWLPCIHAKYRAFREREQNMFGQTPLHIAGAGGNVENVAELLKYGVSAAVSDSRNRTPLHLTCAKRSMVSSHDISESSVKIASLLLKAGARVNAVDRKSRTPLHRACLDIPEPQQPGSRDTAAVPTTDDTNLCVLPNIVSMVELLLAHGASVGCVTDVGATPLHLACFSGTTWRESRPNALAVVKRLLDAGADLRATTADDEMPLHFAAAHSSREVAVELIRRGAPIMARNRHSETPLHYAARAGNNPVAEELLGAAKIGELGVFAVTKQRSTPLHLACQFYDENGDEETRERSLKLVRTLLEHGAQVHKAKNLVGISPFEIAQRRGLDEVVSLLREFGGDPPALSDMGWALLRRVGKAIKG